MEERQPIAVNIHLPGGTLEGLTRLVEQLRYLAAEVGGAGVPAASGRTYALERGENPGFDLERFREAAEGPVAPPAADAAVRDLPGAVPAAVEPAEGPAAPGSTQADAGAELPEAPTAGWTPAGTDWAPGEAGDAPSPPPDVRAVQAAEGGGPEFPVFQNGPRSLLEAPPAAAASFSGMPEAAGGRWTGVAEELSGGGDAPLTARAVSQAFRRDGRRYDNGFTLY